MPDITPERLDAIYAAATAFPRIYRTPPSADDAAAMVKEIRHLRSAVAAMAEKNRALRKAANAAISYWDDLPNSDGVWVQPGRLGSLMRRLDDTLAESKTSHSAVAEAQAEVCDAAKDVLAADGQESAQRRMRDLGDALEDLAKAEAAVAKECAGHG